MMFNTNEYVKNMIKINVKNERIWLMEDFIVPESLLKIAISNFFAGMKDIIARINIAERAVYGMSKIQLKIEIAKSDIANNTCNNLHNTLFGM